MAKALSILYVSSELYPFAKVGGKADSSYSLPLALRDLGHDMRVMLPKYGSVSERKNKIHEINRLRDIPIPIGEGAEPATVKSSSVNNPRSKVQAYITTNQKYFEANKGIYFDIKTGVDFKNNVERFIYFNRSVIETCMLLGWYPDIIHCNDWHSAMIPAFARVLFPAKFKKTKIIFTIHNFAHQGVMPLSGFKLTGLPEEALAAFKHKNQINLTKGAMHYANYITTTSPSYAEQLLADKKHGNGLNTILKERQDTFRGIRNGIDTWTWNPETDSLITKKYAFDYEDYKYDNKIAMINKFDFEYNPKTPLVSMVTRLADNKGIGLFIDAADEIFKEDIQFVMLAWGNPELRDKVQQIADKYPEKFKFKYAQDDSLAHELIAGSDIMIFPSEYEPSGLTMMYALAYGTLPIARLTGAYKDLGEVINPEAGTGNCFGFEKYETKGLLEAFKASLESFKNKEAWETLAKNAMDGDYSWQGHVKMYDEIYKLVVKEM